MKSDYEAAKYKCLRMNRDNDGDGTIDENEVQWYLAAINQLTDLWIGEWSFDQRARLTGKRPDRGAGAVFRQQYGSREVPWL